MNTMLALFNLGGTEIILILALVLIMFGAKKLPELAKGLGQGIKEFKKATKDVSDEMHNAMDDRYEAPRPKQLPPETREEYKTIPRTPIEKGDQSKDAHSSSARPVATRLIRIERLTIIRHGIRAR